MGIFEEGKTECVKELLKPAERVIKQGLDIYVDSFNRRERLWMQIEENYDRYLDGECGEFLRDLDTHFRAKFEGALAILAWSFWKNQELYPPAQRRYRDREIQAVERILKYNVFEIYSKDDIMKKIMHRDNDVLSLLREYYHGVDRWIEEVLNDPEVKLPLRQFLKHKWDSYKGKVNAALSEAITRFDWFRDFLFEAEKEKETVERIYRKKLEEKEEEIQNLRNEIRELIRSFEDEKRELMRRMELAKAEEIEKLKREKEELIRQFELERQRLIEDISRMKDEEVRRELEEQLKRAQEEMLKTVEEMEEQIRRKEEELRRKEEELKRKELELSQKEKEMEENGHGKEY